MKRTCTKCGEKKDVECFAWRSFRKGLRHWICKDCHKVVRRTYYENNKKRVNDRVHARRDALTAWVRSLKLDFECKDCGIEEPIVLEFHHRDPKTKERSISRMANLGWGKAKILKEIEKCDVLCKNCHAIVHYRLRASVV